MKAKNKKLILKKETISNIGLVNLTGGGPIQTQNNEATCWKSCVGTCTAVDATLVGYCS